MKKVVLSLVLFMSMLTPAFGYDSDEITNISVYEKINPAIVAIDAKIKNGTSSGSGCIVSSKGLILTSSHVVLESNEITVRTSDGSEYKAEVVKKTGKDNDLTLLKINSDKPFKTIVLGNSAAVKVGQKVLAIGNPFGFNGTLTQGIVSRIDTKRNKIQTDAAINPGSSGGPLLNTSGEVIGINQAIYNPDNNTSNIGIGFAIPINEAREVLK